MLIPILALWDSPLWWHRVRRGGNVSALHRHWGLLCCRSVHSAIAACSTSLKGHSMVSHFVTSNNYLSNSLWWELALRRLLWLQEVQQGAPNDALCYFGRALAPRESAFSKGQEPGAFNHQEILGMPVLSGTGACRLPFAFYLLSAPAQVEQPSSLSIFLTSGNAAASWYVLTSHSGTAGALCVPMSSLPLKQPFIIHHVQ